MVEKMEAKFNKVKHYIKRLFCFKDTDSYFRAIPWVIPEKDKGDFFEVYIYALLKSGGYEDCDEVWLYDDFPPPLKERFGLPEHDEGIDIVVKKRECYIPVQVKWRSNYFTSMPFGKLATFFACSFATNTEMKQAWLFCTLINPPSGIDVVNKLSVRVRSILVEEIKQLHPFTYNVLCQLCSVYQKMNIQKQLRCYQEPIVSTLTSYFEKYERGKLIACCGSGKTLMCLRTLRNLKCKRILYIFPWLTLAGQIYLESRSELGLDALIFASDSEVKSSYPISVTTNEEELEIFVKENNQFLLICTYQSCSKLYQVLEEQDIDIQFTVFDEAHHLAGKNHDNNKLKLLDLPGKKLFTTATEKIIIGDLTTMDDPMFGTTIYRYTFGDGIRDGAIVDYNILTYFSTHDFSQHQKLVYDQDKHEKVNFRYKIIAKFLISHFVEGTISKLLTFHKTIANAQLLAQYLREEANEQEVELPIFALDCNTSMRNRKRHIYHYIHSEMAIICNVNIFTEGTDIPCIDSVCFCDPMKSQIKIIQATSRCLRSYKDKKRGMIFVPAILPEKDFKTDGELKKLRNILSTFREYDGRTSVEVVEWHPVAKFSPHEHELRDLIQELETLSINDMLKCIKQYIVEHNNTLKKHKTGVECVWEMICEIAQVGETFQASDIKKQGERYLEEIGGTGSTPHQSISRIITQDLTNKLKRLLRIVDGTYRRIE